MSPAARSSSLVRLILLGLLVASLVWVVWLRRAERRPTAPSERLGPGPGFGTVSRFVFSGPADSVVVERRDDAFELIHPIRDRADPLFLAEVTRQAEQLRAGRVLPDSGASAYGLAPPRARVVLRNDTGGLWTAAVGDTSPVGSEVYLRAGAGGTIALVDRFLAQKYFEPRLDDLRDRASVQFASGPLDSLRVLAAAGDVRASRRGEEGWRCRIPPGLKLDPGRVGAVIQAFRTPGIQGFIPRGVALRTLGLDPPRATWVLFQGSRVETVRVGNPTPDLKKVRVLPSGRAGAALISADFFHEMVGGWKALADLHLVATPAESLREVTFLGDPKAGSYREQEGTWIRLPGGHAVARVDDLERQLRNLALIQWRSWPSGREAPGPGQATLRLLLRSPTQAETLDLAAPRDSTGLARSTVQRLWGEVEATDWRIWRYRADHPE